MRRIPLELVLDQVGKKFNDLWAVKDFSARLGKGVYALLGPNGSGKTTLMRMMAGILKPSQGKILLNDEDIRVLDERYRDLLGYLPQEFGVYKNFTAERFLKYFASLKGLNRANTQKKVNEVLELVHLTEEKKKKIGTFSGGMKQRIGIAQALLNDPKVLIVDEPTAGLDPEERIRFRNLLSNISQDRIVFFSTHIVSDIEYIAKEILVIKEGQLQEQSNVQGFIKAIEGKVWKAVIQEEQVERIQKTFKVGNVQHGAEGISVRMISDQKPVKRAKSVEPNVEDVYLYYFSDVKD